MSAPAAAFYFDLASPRAYLAAERILAELGRPAQWRGVIASELPGAEPYAAFRCREEEHIFRAEIERGARAIGLQPVRWPEPFPFDSGLAMRAVAFASSIGRAVPFAQAAFRQAYAGGRSLEDPDTVLIAAAACEMHPASVLRALQLRSTAQQLAQSTAEAAAAGVREVPAIVLGDEVFAGERALERSAAYLAGAAGARAAGAGGRHAAVEGTAGEGTAGEGTAGKGTADGSSAR